MYRRLTPEKAQQWIALLGQSPQPLSSAAEVFPGNDPDVTGKSLTIAKPFRITQENIGRQCRDRSHAGMRHQQSRCSSPVGLLQDSLVQFFDLRFEPFVHRL